MPSKPDDPDNPSTNSPSNSSSKEKSDETSKSKEGSTTKKYKQLIKRISRPKESDDKNEDQPFDIKKRVEIKRPEEDELKKKLSELSSKLEKLKAETKSVLHTSSSKISKSKETGNTDLKELPSDSDKSKNNTDIKSPLGPKTIPKITKVISGPSFLEKIQAMLLDLKLFVKRSPSTSKMSTPPAAGSRPMRYPYTYTAKIAQFPLKFYIKNNWMWRYYFIAVAVSFPLFYKIGRLSNSPENVKKWEEIRRRDFTPGHH